ncbi:MAG: PAS domain S-box protein [Desulfobacteraceae bacterium]|nr:PAS domain S-box protein [Desulfobacteraceae bacterium]
MEERNLINLIGERLGNAIERLQGRDALRESEEKHRRLFETMAQGIVYQEADGTVISANPAAERILGLSLEQMRGKTSINPRWRMIKEDGTEVPDKDHPAVIAVRTGRTVGPVIRGVFHPDRNTYVWLSITVIPLFQPGETKPFQIYATFEDITERKQNQEVLIESESLFRGMFNDHSAVMLLIEPDTGQIIKANQAAVQYYGYTLEKMLQMKIQQLNISSPEQIAEQMHSALKKHINVFEFRHLLADGQVRDVEVHSTPITIQHQKLLFSIIRDITDLKLQEDALIERETLLNHSQAMASMGSFIWNLPNDSLTWSKNMYVIHGLNETSFVGNLTEVSNDLIHPEDRTRIRAEIKKMTEARRVWSMEFRIVRPDGKERVMHSIGEFKLNDSGIPVKCLGIHQDITERKHAEATIRREEEKFRTLVENTVDWVWQLDTSGRYIYVSPQAEALLGYGLDEILGKSPFDFMTPSEAERIIPIFSKLQKRYERIVGLEDTLLAKDGTKVIFETNATPLFGKEEDFIGYMGTCRNITERKHTEKALKENEEKYRTILNEMSEGYHEVDLAGNFTFFNEAFLNIFGYSGEEMTGTNFSRYAAEELIAKNVYHTYNKIFTTGKPVQRCKWDIIRKDGQRRTLEYNAAVVKDSKDIPKGFRGIVRDITESRRAEAERETLQSQLQQAQKMESVGRLAGGVAHDFNNMLGIILGHTELALLKTDEDNDLVSDLNEIQKAAKRSADITKQLLAFARKDVISPKQIDLNDTVESMLNMLRRLIGEDIDLVWKPAAHLWPIKMDPSQIDQILANLCVNARDAITGVGKLTIETGRHTFDAAYCNGHPGFVPGDYVLLAVSDNGCGMDKEILENLFEPFFTTKEVGKGTGLGLATIYGIVKQNNGFINVYSEPGQGSTFRIYLPRLFDDEETDKAVLEKKAVAGGTETILLVEDEPTILRMTRMMLGRKGYSVIFAATPAEAIDLAKAHADKIHLLITDVVMPEMNGRDLAGQISELYPGIRLLFMSGYTADVIAHQGVLDDEPDMVEMFRDDGCKMDINTIQ